MKSILTIGLGIFLGFTLVYFGYLAMTIGLIGIAADAVKNLTTASFQRPYPSRFVVKQPINAQYHQQSMRQITMPRASISADRRNPNYQPDPECQSQDADWETVIECANRYIRAQRALENQN